MRLYIIRHAQSFNNALSDLRDRVSDPPLTELGLRQADLLAEIMAKGQRIEQLWGASSEDTGVRQRTGVGLNRLYCSAMHRSLQTAYPVSQALGLYPEVWIDIHESGGIYLEYDDDRGIVGYPGKNRSAIMKEFPGYVLPEEVTEDGWWGASRGQEDWFTCQGRAIRVADQLKKWADRDERIGMVTHGGFIDALLKALTNQLPGDQVFFHHFNTAITRIDFAASGHLDVRYINRIDHLPKDMIS
jgi:2,3-bisphosphoglycerate-dependent phosphoglycerate mutase